MATPQRIHCTQEMEPFVTEQNKNKNKNKQQLDFPFKTCALRCKNNVFSWIEMVSVSIGCTGTVTLQ